MTWNWQQSDWPDFSWDRERLSRAEDAFLIGGGVVLGALQHLDEPGRERVTIEAICAEAMSTSEIEGEMLDRESVQSSIRKEFGLQSDRPRSKPAEEGISGMLVDLYRSFAGPLSHETLFQWHAMMLAGRKDRQDVGRYRRSTEPMQVVSGPMYSPRVHFEAPPSPEIPERMGHFVEWFNRTAPGGPDPLPAVTRAGVAHLYFESLHPFEDGNGRIGRAISEKALAQGLGKPALSALAGTILLRRKAYYAALGAANRSNEISRWLAWFAGIAVEAQRRSNARISFLLAKARLLERLRGNVNSRQEKALLRMLREGPEGFSGGLSAKNYMTITGTPPATTTRDLSDLVSKGALTRSGKNRYARYHLSIPRRQVDAVTLGPAGELL